MGEASNQTEQHDASGGVTRRQFVKTAVAAGLVASTGAALGEETRKGEMIYRALGRTGERGAAIWLGGYHIGGPKDENESIKNILTAIDGGINFLDNFWGYHDSNSEVRMVEELF